MVGDYHDVLRLIGNPEGEVEQFLEARPCTEDIDTILMQHKAYAVELAELTRMQSDLTNGWYDELPSHCIR